MMEKDSFKTISKPSNEVLFKDKSSKFFGYAFPVKTEADVKARLEQLRKEHQSAGHFCYAYQFGTDERDIVYRTSDDGEPNNSAGKPIYGQIQSFEITNILIVVVRYFGGTKLGVSGLINAYKTTAQLALEASKIVIRTIKIHFLISFEYKHMNTVMRIIKEKNLKIVNQTLELDCKIEIAVRKKHSEAIFQLFDRLYEIEISKMSD